MENIYRELTPNEVKLVLEQKEMRTKHEKSAYRLLPGIMKANVERNPPIAFKDCNVTFFPDLFFRKEKICIELDGGYHWKRIRQDAYRDETFAKHGFTTIRIKNCDTSVNVSFWQRLVEGLEKIDNRMPSVNGLITQLRQMIDHEIWSWTQLDDIFDGNDTI